MVELHLRCYQVEDSEIKKAFLMSCAGTEVCSIVGKLCGERTLEQLPYAEIKVGLDEYFGKRPHVLAARHKFYQCKKEAEQSYQQWAAELRGRAKKCKFQCSCGKSYANSMIRDMLVLNSEDKVRVELVRKSEPSLEEALAVASTYEVTAATAVSTGEPMDIGAVCRKKGTHRIKEEAESREKGAAEGGRGKGESRWQVRRACPGCFRLHEKEQCRFRKATCFKCGVVGHIRAVCENAKTDARKRVEVINEVLSGNAAGKILTTVKLCGRPVNFQLDTGAPVSLINLEVYDSVGSPRCTEVLTELRTFGKQKIKVKGKLRLPVAYKDRERELEFIVVDRYDSMNLLGLDAFEALGFKISDEVGLVEQQKVATNVQQVINKHAAVFTEGLGEYNLAEVRIQLKESAKPRFLKARPVPLALREKVEKEIDRLVEQGVISPVNTSEWATPIVAVRKADGSVRLCGDFKSTINGQLEVDQFPIPRAEDLFQKLAGGQRFTKIDLKDAYLQLKLDQQSQKLAVINTQKGLFKYNRLPFGVASAAAIFQRCLSQLTAGVQGCVNYLDDILVTGASEKEHLKNLDGLLEKLEECGMKVNLRKCQFFKEEVAYLGHVIDSQGIRPLEDHVAAIENLPVPANLTQLQSFLGKVNYYGKFIRGFATVAAPLNALRKKGVKYVWSAACDKAFKVLKAALKRTAKLAHYVPGRVTTVAADASEYGIGAVLSQKDEEGVERPVAFISKTLNKHQRNYAQIQKEALSIIYAIKRFNHFLYGAKFHIITDHKPLVSLFRPDKKIPDNTVKKLQRWALFLTDYTYSIHYRPTAQHSNADALSRLPAGPDAEFDTQEVACLQADLQDLAELNNFPVDARWVARETDKDVELNQVRALVRSGWRVTRGNAAVARQWARFKERLSVKAGVLLLGAESEDRVVVPRVLRRKVLELLHEGHWGVSLTKRLARQHCYWRGINEDIEKLVRGCEPCQLNQRAPRENCISWPTPSEPWERIHADFAGPFWNSMWLLVVDALSNYPYAVEVKSTTAEATIKALQEIFLTEGLPKTLVTDNGPQFASQQFKDFCVSNGMKHVFAPPFHPQSNGEAERFVQTFKTAMRKARDAGTPKQLALWRVLASYRTIPAVSGVSPAQALHGRQPRVLLSLLQPGEQREASYEAPFKVGSWVYAATFKGDPRWEPGKVVRVKGNRAYVVQLQGRVVIRHQDQLRRRYVATPVRGGSHRLTGSFSMYAEHQEQQQPEQSEGVAEPQQQQQQPPHQQQQQLGVGHAAPVRVRSRKSRRYVPYAAHLGAEGVMEEAAAPSGEVEGDVEPQEGGGGGEGEQACPSGAEL